MKSKEEGWYYVGMSENVEKRLESHNKGRVKSTKYRKPYKVIYTEKFDNRQSARDREKQLKNGNQKRRLINKILKKESDKEN